MMTCSGCCCDKQLQEVTRETVVIQESSPGHFHKWQQQEIFSHEESFHQLALKSPSQQPQQQLKAESPSYVVTFPE